jgi:hypothetical protein
MEALMDVLALIITSRASTPIKRNAVSPGDNIKMQPFLIPNIFSDYIPDDHSGRAV